MPKYCEKVSPRSIQRSTPKSAIAANVYRRVDERRDRDVARRDAGGGEARLAPDELQEEEAENRDRGRPAAEPLRVGERRRSALPGDEGEAGRDGAADRPPRVEGAEDVAEEHADAVSPSQKVTKTKLTEKFRSGASTPSRPVQTTRTVRATPISPASAAVNGLSSRPERRGSAARRGPVLEMRLAPRQHQPDERDDDDHQRRRR